MDPLRGAFFLAVSDNKNSATILNNSLSSGLLSIISPEEAGRITDSLSAINDLSPEQQAAVRQLFSEGYGRQNIFLAVLTGVGLIPALFMWERHPRRAV